MCTQLGELLRVVLSELVEVRHVINADDFQRAKTQLKSSLCLALESRMVMFEDIARYNERMLLRKMDCVNGLKYFFAFISPKNKYIDNS